MSSQVEDFKMDIGSVLPVLRTQTRSGAGTEEGHWFSEDTYDIPGGKVDTTKETSVQSGEGWHTQATKQTSVMKQKFSGNELQPKAGALQLASESNGGAVKLLNDLDTLSDLLGSDLSKSNVTQSVKTTTTQSKAINLSKVSSPFHGQPFEEAVKNNRLDTTSGVYKDPSGKSFSLAEAFEKDLINPDSAIFINPRDNQSLTLHNAIQREMVSKHGQYREPSGRTNNLKECMAKSVIIAREVEPIAVDSETREEHYKFYVDKVVDPTTGEYISVEDAIQRGIFDPEKGKYFNVKTGELLSVQEAVTRNLMVTSAKGPEQTRSSSAQLIKTSKAFNVVGAIHPILKKRMSLNEAIAEGILDRSKGLYIDTLNNKKYKIQEAIQKGLVVAEQVTSKGEGPTTSEIVTNKESTFTVIGVLHPNTGERLSISKATELGVLDTNQGLYKNIETGETMSMTEAIEKGLVLVEKGMVKKEDRDRKVSSLHIDEEEEELTTSVPLPSSNRSNVVWTVVEEVKTETKKWVITSVIDPRTKEKISFDDALLERVLDQQNGKYCNPETGEEMSIGQAIEKNLIQGELVSVNMDEEEYSSFQVTADSVEHVRDPRTHKIITYDAACKLGLIDKQNKTFHNPITNQTLSLNEAAQRGFIKKKPSSKTAKHSVEPEVRPKAANAVEAHKERFHSKRNVFEEAKHRDQLDGFHEPMSSMGESMRVEETATMETDYVQSNRFSRPVIQPTASESRTESTNSLLTEGVMSSTSRPTYRRPAIDPKLLNRVDAVLGRAKLYTDESVISSTESHLSGYTTDWQAERVYNLRTGDELTLDQAVDKGILDAKQVALMRRFKQDHSPSKMTTESWSAAQKSSARSAHSVPPYSGRQNGFGSDEAIQPTQYTSTQHSTESTSRMGRSSSVPTENTSMVVKVSQTQQCQSRIGPLSYHTAVRLGLFNIKTGKYRDPTTGLVLGIQDAVSRGYIQANGEAITNLNTGARVTLADCIQRNLIDSETGKIFESKLKQLNIAVPNQFMSSRSARNAPINFEDALKVGLLNPHTAEFQHPQSDESSSIGDAVAREYIAGKSVVVQDPTSGTRYYLDDALKRGIVNPNNGGIFDVVRGERVMTLYEALKTKLFESVFDPFDSTLIDPNNGQRVDVNQAVKRSLLGHNTCVVYDTEKNRQVSFDDAVEDGIVDRMNAIYADKKGGRRLVCKTAAEMGLIEPIGAPVLNKLRVLESIHKLYAPPGDSISAPSYTMYEDVKSKEVSTVRKPEIRTEVDTQEYKTERTIKLSGKTDGQRSDSIEFAPGDKVLVPKPFQPGRAPQQRQEPVIQKSVQKKPLHSATSPKSPPIVEEPIRKKVAQLYYEDGQLTAKKPVEKPTSPFDEQPPMTSPQGHKIISVTEEVYETVETKSSSKKPRAHVDDISAPEYFTKGENVDIQIEDDEIDNYELSLRTEKPPDVEWDLNLMQQPGKEQKVTKVVEETVEEVVDAHNQPNMQITVASTEHKSPSPPLVEEPVQQQRKPPVEKAPSPVPVAQVPVQQAPQRIRDKEIIIIEREGGNVTKNISINIESALEEGCIDLSKREFTHPVTGEKMSLAEAIRRGLIQGSNEEIKNAITSHYEQMKLAGLKKAIMEYSTTKEFSSIVEKEQTGTPLSECLANKALDPRSGKYADPRSGLMYTLKEAVEHGMIDGDSAHFTSPGNKKTYTLREALDKKVLDNYGKWISPLTGQKASFNEAIKKGHVKMVSSEQTINKMTTITEVKKVRVDYVIHPLSRERISYNQAVIEGIISTVDGIYRNPSTNDTLPLDDAVKHGLICGEILDTKRKTEERILDSTNIVARSVDEADMAGRESHESSLHVIKSPMKSYVIDTVVDPRTNKTISAGEAIKLGIIDPATATYHNIVTGEQMTFEEAIKKQLLRCMETTDLPDGEKFNILGVICPQTGREISMSQALDEGVLDFQRGVYVNTVTRKTISMADAIDRKLIRCEGRLPEGMTSSVRNEEEEDITNAVYTENKSYTITGARDTRTDKIVGIKEAIRLGILDHDLSTYNDLHTGATYTIQEAIDRGLLMAELEDSSKPKNTADASMTVNTTKVFDIEAVVDPQTKEEVSAQEAVNRGIIDEATGDYVNVDTMESWSMDKAIKQGLVKAKPIPAHDTVSFSIAAVVDPKTGEKMTVSDALRHGFLDRGRKTFCNAHTGQVCSLDEALRKGWIITKSNYDKTKTQTGFTMRGQPAKAGGLVAPSGFQTFTILSVLDARSGEDLPVIEAVRRGILDESKRNYKDTLTGEVMLLDTAVKRNFIKLGPSSSGVTKSSFSEALRRGYINSQTGKFACPSTGQVMSVDEAVRRGLLVDDAGHRLGGEDMTVKSTVNRQSRSFETALRDGMIDSRSGKFMHPESGEAMTLGRAVNQGHLAPKTQWRAYSYKTQTQQVSPPSPGSVISSASHKYAPDPIYSTIHKGRSVSASSQRDPGPLDIHTARERGFINMQTGEITLPQYGTSMLVDDAIMQGLLVTKVPLSMILSKPPSPHSLPIHQAFQQGLINPLNLSVQTSNRQFISFEDALSSGLLYPLASNSMRREGSMAREVPISRDAGSHVRAASMPPTSTPAGHTYSYKKQTTRHSTSGGQHIPAQRGATLNGHVNGSMMNGGAHLKPGMGTLPPNFPGTTGTQQRRVWEKQQHKRQQGSVGTPKASYYSDHPAQAHSPLLNGNAHFINGKLFACLPGYVIEGGGVVNTMTGENMSWEQAQRMNVVQQIPDDEYDAGTLPPNNSMFNRQHFTANTAV